MIDQPASADLSYGVRIVAWQQPKDQVFRTTDGETGGLLAINLAQKFSEQWSLTYELAGKTEGWVMGTPYLDRTLEIRFGTRARL
jgi:hypothetical protein